MEVLSPGVKGWRPRQSGCASCNSSRAPTQQRQSNPGPIRISVSKLEVAKTRASLNRVLSPQWIGNATSRIFFGNRALVDGAWSCPNIREASGHRRELHGAGFEVARAVELHEAGTERVGEAFGAACAQIQRRRKHCLSRGGERSYKALVELAVARFEKVSTRRRRRRGRRRLHRRRRR